jgi:serralysin
VTTDFTRREDAAWGVAIQADGKIVAAGDAGFRTGNSRFAVARYNADGTLDSTFSGDGKVTTQFTRHDDPVSGAALQSDGRIVVSGGAAADGPNSNFALARYNSDGTLDLTFGGDGKVRTDFVGRHDFANAVAIQADGKVVAGGLAGFSRTRGTGRFGVARYNADGMLDTAFSGDGKLTTNFTRGDDSVQGVAVQSDGSIVAAGIAAYRSSNATFALARYTQDGTLDTSFGGDGKVRTAINGNAAYAYDVVLQPDGKIVAAGVAAGRGGRFAVGRFDSDGGLDVTFGVDGTATTNFTRHNDFAYGLALQADGNLVLAGGSGWGGSNPKIALARYLGS